MGERRGVYRVWVERSDEKHLETLRVDEKILLKWVLKEAGCKGTNWIPLAQDRYRWRPLVNAVMNFGLP